MSACGSDLRLKGEGWDLRLAKQIILHWTLFAAKIGPS